MKKIELAVGDSPCSYLGIGSIIGGVVTLHRVIICIVVLLQKK
jgi:hypothetical protein